MMADNLIKVTLEITGFYFTKTTHVEPSATILDVLEQVREETKTGDAGAIFNFLPGDTKFVRHISVEHLTSPKTNQSKNGKPLGPEGIKGDQGIGICTSPTSPKSKPEV